MTLTNEMRFMIQVKNCMFPYNFFVSLALFSCEFTLNKNASRSDFLKEKSDEISFFFFLFFCQMHTLPRSIDFVYKMICTHICIRLPHNVHSQPSYWVSYWQTRQRQLCYERKLSMGGFISCQVTFGFIVSFNARTHYNRQNCPGQICLK